MKRDFGDARRTEIPGVPSDLTLADLITEEERVVTISHGGYAKPSRWPLSGAAPRWPWQGRDRGEGRGLRRAPAGRQQSYHPAAVLQQGQGLLVEDLRDSRGLAHSRGRPLVNLLPLDEGERITAMLQVDLEALRKQAAESDEELDDAEGLVIEHDDVDDVEGDDDSDEKGRTHRCLHLHGDGQGTVKKTPLVQFSRPRTSGLIALKLEEGDTLIAPP